MPPTSTMLTFVIIAAGATNATVGATGDVFIVTKSAQNIKLGLVQIDFLPEASVRSLVTGLRKTFRERIESAREKETLTYAEELIARTALTTIGIKQKMASNNEESELATEEVETKRRLEKATPVAAAARDELKRCEAGWCAIQDLPKSRLSTKTDADGKFSLKLKPGKYALRAVSERVIGRERETYCWFLWVQIGLKTDNRIMLSNDNLVPTECADCIVHSQ
jgi:hypothetical protein